MAKRDPLSGKLVTLIGGSGFLGHHVAQHLLARGARLRVASRHPERAYSLKPLANLGQLQFGRCDVTKPASIAAAVAGVDAVVNLAGTFGRDVDAVMGSGAGAAAQAAAAAGVQAMVHVSAIGADGASEAGYAQAKAHGEQAVLAAFPTASVMRPSIIFGEEEGFVPLMAGMIAAMPVLPVFAPEAKIQPVYVDDVAAAIAAALADPAAHGGKIFELAGPQALTMMEFNRMIAAAQGRERHFIAMPDAVSGLFAAIPGTPMGRDQWLLLKAGNVASGQLPGLATLGIEAKPLGLFVDRWMVRYKKHGRFTASGPLTS
ncbi:MAG: NAD(P)H-binding protein [Sphingomonadales bacterium]|nr:NAD(P)H-binding protein [Sphingomonadales bacterium]MBD3775065.1 NAD(P)H-binding protein [Paracoccaceae bacterium]